METRVPHPPTEALLGASELAQRLLEYVADSIVACDADGRLTLCNQTAREWFGADLVGLSLHEWANCHNLYRDDGTTLLPAEEFPLVRILQGETLTAERMVIVRPGRSARFLHASGGTIRDRKGRKLGAVVTMRDVTDLRRLAERTAELEASNRNLLSELEVKQREKERAGKEQALLRCILDSASDLIFIKDRDGVYQGCNRASEQFLGLSESNQIGKTDYDFFDAEVAARICATDQRVMKTGKPVRSEEWVTYADGQKALMDTVKVPYRGPDGGLLGLVGIARDITARKLAEEKMLRSDQRLRLHSEKSPLGFLEWDDKFRAVEWNAACERIFGYTREEAIGRHAKDLILPIDVHDLVEGVYQSLMRQTGGQHSINENVTKDGRIIICEWFNTTLIDEEGNAIGVASVCRDITEQKRMEKELSRYREHLEEQVRHRTAALEAANTELEAFAYSVSHDLRTPLRHIDGFMGLLQIKAGTLLDEQGHYFMKTISETIQKMGLLIDDLLAFSRMGRQAISHQPVDLGRLVDDILGELEPDTAGRQIDWCIGDLPVVTGDAAMLNIVLANLIYNALKFTRMRGKARIEIGALSGQTSEAVVFVRDNGVGFDMNHADKLFDVFQRFHHAEEFEGTGIGLASVRRIIDRHGGRTWAEGKVDQGATFYFSLPLAMGTIEH